MTQAAPTTINSGGSTTDSSGESNSPDIQRMIVRTSNMTLMVSDVSTALDTIAKLAEDSQGFVVSSNQWKDNGALLGTITIRVPAGEFDNAMFTLRGMADEVTSENTSAQDVTEEYTDLNSTLTNLQATEAQLLEIMKKAVTVDDILAVQNQLTNIQGQIEITKGRMKYLEQTSATSLISVSLTQSKLTVNLTASNGRVVRSGDNVYFTATISGGFEPYNYKWDFGDKSSSTEETPVHSYNSSGKFTVSLTVTDDKGNTATDTRTDYITAQSGWDVGSVAKSAWSGLRAFFHVLVNILIWLGIFSPIWIIGGGIWYWIWRRRKIRIAKKAKTT
jgi:PKD repeat protein